MTSSAATVSMTRAQAKELVRRAEHKTGSRMAAYEHVARKVGSSSGWIRKFVKGYEAKEPRATLYENIRAHYEALCDRVEQDNRADEQRLRSLRGNSNAIATSMAPESRAETPAFLGED